MSRDQRILSEQPRNFLLGTKILAPLKARDHVGISILLFSTTFLYFTPAGQMSLSDDFQYSFNKCLLSTYYGPHMVLGTHARYGLCPLAYKQVESPRRKRVSKSPLLVRGVKDFVQNFLVTISGI